MCCINFFFNSSTFRFDFSTVATIACKESLCLLIPVTLPLDNSVSVLLLVIRSWVSFVSRSRLAASAIFFPLNVSLSSKFYHAVRSEVPLFCWEASKFHNKISQYHIKFNHYHLILRGRSAGSFPEQRLVIEPRKLPDQYIT